MNLNGLFLASHKLQRAFLACVCAAPLTIGGVSRAQEVIPMTVIDAYAPTALWVRVFMNYFMPEVDRRLAETDNYEIDWISAFGGTVAKTGGVLEAIQYGLADIGIITSPYHPDKVPFYNISYVTPLVTADIGLVARTVHEIVDRYPELRQEWDNYNQVFLTAAGAIDTYQVLMSEPIESLEDFRGKKICGIGLNLRYVQGLGAAAVSSNLGDLQQYRYRTHRGHGRVGGISGSLQAIRSRPLHDRYSFRCGDFKGHHYESPYLESAARRSS